MSSTLHHMVATPAGPLWSTEDAGPPGSPVVVIVHGSLDRSSSFARVQRHLSGCTVVRYDRRGYGRSLDAGIAGTFQRQVDDLASIVAGRQVALLGHSFGGVIALALAARDPALVTGVAVYEPPTPWSPSWPASSAGGFALTSEDPAEAAERFMRRMIGDARWAKLPPSTKAARRAEGPALVDELRAVRAEPGAPFDPSEIEVPVVVGHGSESSERHVTTAVELAASLPHGRSVVVEGAGHGVHLTHPDRLAALVRDVLGPAEGAR